MFRCRDLLSLPTMSKARLVTGEKGLDNGIRWSYKAEGMNFGEWVHGQELLIVSTPVIHSDDFNLHQLIKEAIRLKLSGVILLVGEDYIKSISRQTLDMADKFGLPVFSLPGNIPLVDIFEELGHAIVYQERPIFEQDDLLSEVVFGDSIDEHIIASRASLLGYRMGGANRIFMINIELPETVIDQGFIGNLTASLQTLFWNSEGQGIVSFFHHNLVGITDMEEEKLEEIFNSFYEDLNERNKDIRCRIGVGRAYEEIKQLKRSFEEASKSLKLASPIKWYSRLGFISVLMDFEDKTLMLEFMKQVLGNVIIHDEDSSSDLMQTLIAYFDCNENMKEVAAKKYIHPNTVKYRLQQIQELTGHSLAVSHEKMELYNAILVWRIFQ